MDRFGIPNPRKSGSVIGADRQRFGPSCVLLKRVPQGRTESGGIVLAANAGPRVPSGGVTLKRRCTYRPSVIYLIVNKLLSLSLPIVNKAPCFHCHLLLLLKSRARDKTLSTHAPGSLSPAPCSTSTTLSRQPIHSAYLRRTLTPASVCSTSRVSRRAGQATNPLTPAMPRPYLRVMVSLAEAWRLKSSVATRAIGTGCP